MTEMTEIDGTADMTARVAKAWELWDRVPELAIMGKPAEGTSGHYTCDYINDTNGAAIGAAIVAAWEFSRDLPYAALGNIEHSDDPWNVVNDCFIVNVDFGDLDAKVQKAYDWLDGWAEAA